MIFTSKLIKMKELPILFKTEMVQALLAGRKTITRRTNCLEKINANPNDYNFQSLVLHATGKFTFCEKRDENPKTDHIIECKPKYQKDDLLWVKETYRIDPEFEDNGDLFPECYVYYASEADIVTCTDGEQYSKDDWKWKPSIYMPKEAARIWLRVINVKCERLQDITVDDAVKEGIKKIEGLGWKHYSAKSHFTKEELKDACPFLKSPILSFLSLWESINGKESLERNPWVFAYEFELVSISGKEAICM